MIEEVLERGDDVGIWATGAIAEVLVRGEDGEMDVGARTGDVGGAFSDSMGGSDSA
jgi:hypothetical protein